jgi:hypothetical protein
MSESTERLRRFAQIYKVKMDAKPYMEIRARYDSMSEAKLIISERVHAENLVDTGKLDELLHPENYLPTILKAA